MERRPWWERLLDRDNPMAPLLLVVLLVLAIGFVLTVGPLLDRFIGGERSPSQHRVDDRPVLYRSPALADRGPTLADASGDGRLSHTGSSSRSPA